MRATAFRRGTATLAVAACTLALAASCKYKGDEEGASHAADGALAAPSGSGRTDAVPAGSAAAADASDDADAAASPEPSGSAAAAPAKCPEVTSAERVAKFDWSRELGVDAATAARLRGVSGTAIETRMLAGRVGTDLRNACGGIAAELGNRGVFASAPAACQAAVDALKATRAKLGPAARVAVHVRPAFCPESIEEVKACAKHCAGTDEAPSATCAGAVVGRCGGTCEGPCEVRPPGVCEGACLGQCESGFAGTCDGTCKGKCNGQALKPPGECRGKCEGACEAVGRGECKGRCVGGCQLHQAACSGMCAGRCSAPVQDPRCVGTLKVAAASAECASYCDLHGVHRMACGAAQVDAIASGAKDPAAAAAYVGAIQRYLPALLKIEAQLKGHLDTLGKAKTAVSAGLTAITAGAGPAMPSLSPCLSSYDKATSEGVATLVESIRAASTVSLAARAR